jgi:hydroxybutyrate-dimer hydrolase
MPDFLVSPVRVARHADRDDLLSGGLGLQGLQKPTPPPFANPAAPRSEELRRRTLWNNWRAIADLSEGGGYGEVYGAVPNVPGREFSAFARLAGARHPHRVLLQMPDHFDRRARCLVVAASSGSRNVYGAVALAGAWGLPRGYAVAYTDKGGGSDYYDADSATGVQLDGTRGGSGAALAFALPASGMTRHCLAAKHLHSGDNPEADWGRHLLQAAQFGLAQMSEAMPNEMPFDFSNTRVIAVGLSNGGASVLRLAELAAAKYFAACVAIAPNVYPDAAGARPLYDYATEAALLQPCALLHPRFDPISLARPGGMRPATAILRCAQLQARELVAATTPQGAADEAYAHLRATGWSDAALETSALSVAFDLWRTLGVGYASAYAGSNANAMPGGYRYSALDTSGRPRASSVADRATWFADGNGLPPSPAIGLVDTLASGDDPSLPGLLHLRGLYTHQSHATAQRLQQSIGATKARLPQAETPVLIVHGVDDGLIPEAFSSAPYAQAARDAGRDVRVWRVHNAQHFDTFLNLTPMGACYLPLLPYAYRALDAAWALAAQGVRLPGDTEIHTRQRGFDNAGAAPLRREHLGTLP